MLKQTQLCVGASLLEVEVATNCPKGGDGGHGGRTVVRLGDQGGSFEFKIIPEDLERKQLYAVEIHGAGDDECLRIAEALEWAAAKLRQFYIRNTD